MKKKIKVIQKFVFLSSLLLLSGYTSAQKINNFYFEEAQPRKTEKLSRFPLSIRGLYKSDKDSSRRIQINEDSLYFEIPMIQVASRNELVAKNYTVTDSLLTAPNNEEFRCIVRDDTVYFADFVKSVLFVANDENVIKKSGDYFVLNRKLDNNYWECILLYKENSKLCLAYFDFEKKQEELNGNKRIKSVKIGNELVFAGNLKEKDFLKLINGDYFPDKQYFEKRFN